MALTQEQKMQIAQQLAQKRKTFGDNSFQRYLGQIETRATSQQVSQQATGETAPLPMREPSLLAKTGSAVGNILGGAVYSVSEPGRVIQRGLDRLFFGKATTPEEQKAGFEQSTGADVDTTAGKLGQFAGGAAMFAAPGSVAAKGVKAAGTLSGFAQGARAAIAPSAAAGAAMGTFQGLGTSIDEGKGALGTAWEVAKQATGGGIIGAASGVLGGGVVGSVGGALQARAARNLELEQLLGVADDAVPTPAGTVTAVTPESISNSASRRRAGFTLNEQGKVVADKKAQEVLRQGVSDKTVAIMQSMSAADKKAAQEMIAIAKKAGDTGLAVNRQQEVVGKAFMQRARDVENINKQAGKQIDEVARTNLAGAQVNATSATDDFFNQLERAGVDVDQLRLADNKEAIAQAFQGSDFEDIPEVHKIFKTISKRVDPDLEGANLDGLALHRAKRFIDNQVTYGRNAGGLSGQAEGILKNLRSGIDEVLDTQFLDYNKANTQYRDSISALDEVRRLIGKDFLGSKDIVELRAGEVLNRLLSNVSAKPMSALKNLETTAKKYGSSYDDDILKQITFADMLDTVYDTTPKRGFAGGVKTGIEEGAASFLDRMRQSGFISAAIDKAADQAKAARGISQEKAQKAIEDFFDVK